MTRGGVRAVLQPPALLLGAALLGACGGESVPQEEGPHELRVSLDTVGVIGQMDGPDELVFGAVELVLPWDEGSVLIHDRQAPSIGWFSLDGAPLQVHAALGDGPGELRVPRSLSRLRSGELLVWDLMQRRLSWFELGEEGFRFRRQLRVALPGAEACAAGERIFLVWPEEGSLLHEIGGDGRVVRSFAEIPPIDRIEESGPFRALNEEVIGHGAALCLDEPARIVLARTAAPQLAAYSLEGDLLWERTLDWVVPVGYELIEGGGHRWVRDPERGMHFAAFAGRWDEESVLVQFIHHSPLEPGQRAADLEATVESLLVGVDDGAIEARVRGLPALRGLEGDLLFTAERDPYPRVLVLRR